MGKVNNLIIELSELVTEYIEGGHDTDYLDHEIMSQLDQSEFEFYMAYKDIIFQTAGYDPSDFNSPELNDLSPQQQADFDDKGPIDEDFTGGLEEDDYEIRRNYNDDEDDYEIGRNYNDDEPADIEDDSRYSDDEIEMMPIDDFDEEPEVIVDEPDEFTLKVGGEPERQEPMHYDIDPEDEFTFDDSEYIMEPIEDEEDEIEEVLSQRQEYASREKERKERGRRTSGEYERYKR